MVCRGKVLLHMSNTVWLEGCEAANPGQLCLHLQDCVQEESHIKLMHKMAEKASIARLFQR